VLSPCGRYVKCMFVRVSNFRNIFSRIKLKYLRSKVSLIQGVKQESSKASHKLICPRVRASYVFFFFMCCNVRLACVIYAQR